MVFRLQDCDFGVTVNGINYNFEHVDSMSLEDPENTRLTRGANAGNKIGIVYKEGTKEAKKLTVTLPGMDPDLFNILKDCHANETRLDCFCVNRKSGAQKIFKNSILSQEPRQVTVDDSVESLNVVLIFESYDATEVRK